jgi:hypothetical protein
MRARDVFTDDRNVDLRTTKKLQPTVSCTGKQPRSLGASWSARSRDGCVKQFTFCNKFFFNPTLVDRYACRSDGCIWVDVYWTGSTMKSIIVISLSIALVTPALAAKKHHHHYARPVSQPAQPPSMAMGMMGPTTSADYQQYLKNLRDSGYDPKNDYQSNGVIRDHLP